MNLINYKFDSSDKGTQGQAIFVVSLVGLQLHVQVSLQIIAKRTPVC